VAKKAAAAKPESTRKPESADQSPPRHWLLKSEPDCYSIDDLARDKKTSWSGVRNYQARNFMRDGMSVGDLVLYYHSSAEPPGVAGIARICKKAHGDLTALDPKDDHYDPKSTKEDPIWVMVDVEFVEKFPRVVSISQLKAVKELATMHVLRTGQRLSVMPVDAEHFEIVARMGRG
jgi:predicted RNA-binding protein with PUA-like domain